MPDTDNTIKNVNEVINETVQWELDCRKQAVTDVLRILSDASEKTGAQFFVTGRLMKFVLKGAIDDKQNYKICLLRPDYDLLVAYLKENENEEWTFSDVYNRPGTIRRPFAFISRETVFSDEHGDLTVNCKIRLIPLDVLPADFEERKKFKENVAEISKDYLKKSGRLNAYRAGKNRDTLLKKIINKSRAFIFRGGITDKYYEKKKDYRQVLTQYDNTDNMKVLGQIEVYQGFEYTYDQVFPLKPVQVEDFTVNVPNDYNNLGFRSRSEKEEELLEARLKLLRTIDEFCQDNGLTYFLGWDLASSVANTHDVSRDILTKGWEICMPRKDYDKFTDLVRATHTPLELLTRQQGMPTTARIDISVTLDEPFEGLLEFENSAVLVPMDNLPDNYEQGLKLCNSAKDAYTRLKNVIKFESGTTNLRLKRGEDSHTDSRKLNKILSSCHEETNRLFTIRNGRIVIIDKQNLFPVTRWELRDFTVSLPAVPYFFHERVNANYADYISEKKENILKKIDIFCSEKDIRYFAIGPLLSGAEVYHQEIPDEINRRWELGLTREEYEKFLREIRADGEKYGLQLEEFFDQECKLPMSRRRITDTGKRIRDAYIYILPFDKFPTDFYLGNGLDNMIAEKNEFFKLLMLSKRFPYRDNNIPFKGEKLERCEQYIETADPLAEFEAIDKLAQSFNDTDRPYMYRALCFTRSKKIAEEDIYPLRREKFRSIEINCPRDGSVWQPTINEELERQVSCIQRADLILLKKFDEVCRELGVGYFVCGGTMLGYVRHGGFIPWDDDVDVAMLRKDYDIFLKKAGDLLPEEFFLQTRETDETIPYVFSKLRLNGTAYVTEYSMIREYHQGVCLDIFPFDYLPNDAMERSEFLEDINKARKIHNQVAAQKLAPPEEKTVPQNEIEKEILEYEEKILAESKEIDLATTQADYLAVATRYNKTAEAEHLQTVASFVPTYTYIDLKDLLPYQRGMFEGIEVSVPKRPDVFLEMQYGDYMQLPPEHNRIAHRLVRWKTWEGSGGIQAAEDDNNGEERTK